MRRLAVGAAAAALPALVLAAGSAGAQPALADPGIAQLPDVVINEVGIDLVDAGPNGDISGNFIELRNTTSNTVSLDGWSLDACDTTSAFTLMTFGPGHAIDPGVSEFFLIADQAFVISTGLQEDLLANLNLDQDNGGLALLDDAAIPSVVHDVKWGTPAFACSGLTDAGVTPDDDNSLQLNTTPPPTWCALPPTPRAANGSC